MATTLTYAPQPRKRRGKSDQVIERENLLQDMADSAEAVEIHDPDGNLLESFPSAFVVTGEMLGVKDASVPVTIGTWAKDAGLSVKVRNRGAYVVEILG